jgi:single-strand DNA-binding protein
MLNSCNFIGNLGADPEVRTFQNGNKVCNLRLAVSETWKDKNTGERKEKTEWVSVAIFSEGLARVAEQYLGKGSKVYISGKLTTRKWQDQSGADRYSTEIVLQGFDAKLVMLDGKSEGGPHRDDMLHERPIDNRTGQASRDFDDEIPF